MRDWIVIAIAISGIVGSFYIGGYVERFKAAERTKTAIEKEMRVQTENELEVRQMGDAARCAALGGKLRKNGECR